MEDGAEPFRVLCTLANEREQAELIEVACSACPLYERAPSVGGSTGRSSGVKLGVRRVGFKCQYLFRRGLDRGAITVLYFHICVKFSTI